MTDKEVNKLLEEIIENDFKITEEPIDKAPKTLPMVALRGKVLFPKTFLNFDVGRAMSVAAVDAAVKSGSEIFIAAQKNAAVEVPNAEDLYNIGVVARIKQVIKIQTTGNVKVAVEALYRASIKEFVKTKGHFAVAVEERPYIPCDNQTEEEACLRVAKKVFFDYAFTDKRIGKEMVASISKHTNPNEFIDNAMSVVNFKESAQQNILDIDDTMERL